jgi:hypothetical protein
MDMFTPDTTDLFNSVILVLFEPDDAKDFEPPFDSNPGA